MNNYINVIGAGLAGCEAAYKIAESGINVRLFEMKKIKKSPAHSMDTFAELVCSNSLKAERISSAAGLLKKEMKMLGSLCIDAAYSSRVAAGGALAVERHTFSKLITEKIRNHPLIEVIDTVVEKIPDDAITIIATGPLTDNALAEDIIRVCGANTLSFYDAAAPIITAESIDMTKAFSAARYGRGTDDYINCPMNKEEYEKFHEALISAESAPLKEFDKRISVYEGCMPIEILAKRGMDSIRFGPLKPVGLVDPRTERRPWAVVQLRMENKEGTLYNIVGFQTNLKFSEQKRVFSLITGLENADFVRYGVMHRNSFIDSPRLLNEDLSLKSRPNIFVAGQLSGVEGYMESAASGIVAGINAVNKYNNEECVKLPKITMIGSLLSYICDDSVRDFQPMGANFGIIPSLETKIRDKQERYSALAERSLEWYKNNNF